MGDAGSSQKRGYLTGFERFLGIALLLMFLFGLPKTVEWWIHLFG